MVRNVAVMYCGLSAPHLNATLPSSVAFERSTGAGDLSADRGKLSVHMQYRTDVPISKLSLRDPRVEEHSSTNAVADEMSSSHPNFRFNSWKWRPLGRDSNPVAIRYML